MFKTSSIVSNSDFQKTQRLTSKEEVSLSALIKKGDVAQKNLKSLKGDETVLAPKIRRLQKVADKGKEASDKLVQANMGLVVYIARKHTSDNILVQDLIQDGNLALVKAAHRFDGSKGVRFSTYAFRWIDPVIKRSISSQNWVLKMSAGQIDKQAKLNRALKKFEEENQRSPSIKELCLVLKETEVKKSAVEGQGFSTLNGKAPDEAEVRELLRVRSSQSFSISLDGDTEYLDEDITVEDVVVDADALKQNFTDVVSALDHLSELDREILVLRFGLGDLDPMTMDEVAKELKRSRGKQVTKGTIRESLERAPKQLLIYFKRKQNQDELGDLIK